MANLIVSGQMIRNGKSPGPMFQIFTESQIGESPYYARVISQLCGDIIAESNETVMARPGVLDEVSLHGGFKTVGEAMEWCHEYIDW